MAEQQYAPNVVIMISGAEADEVTSSSYRPLGQAQAFHVEGITDATVVIEVSNDNSNWFDSGIGDITADGIAVSVDKPYAYIRARVDEYSSGTISVYGTNLIEIGS